MALRKSFKVIDKATGRRVTIIFHAFTEADAIERYLDGRLRNPSWPTNVTIEEAKS
jgi:hypothetical protein